MYMNKLIENLKSRGFEAVYVENKDEARKSINKAIESGASVGFGGSMTCVEIGVQEMLKERGCEIYGFGHYDAEDLYLKAHTSDWYISSANAICETGEIINIDGRSNRIGAIVSGPKNVIIIVGKNKITANIIAGIDRARNIAAPMNAARLNRNTPCKVTGKCENCNSPEKICHNTLIQHHPSYGSRVIVIVVGESLGF